MHNANEKQVGGNHYATGDVQHWDYVQQALDGAYLMGNVTKYVARHRKKNGLQDLAKARHYLEKITEMYQAGELKPARQPGNLGKMPSIVRQFIIRAGLSYWEGRVMVLACLWSSMNDLLEMRTMLYYMESDQKALMQFGVAVEAGVDDAAAEPGAGYVDQDRGGAAPQDALDAFACWLSVQSPTIAIGSGAETPVLLEALERYRKWNAKVGVCLR